MNLQDLITMRKIATSTPEQLAKLNIQCFTQDRKGRPIQRTDASLIMDFVTDVMWAMRNYSDNDFRGYLTRPSTCDNPECPFYTGRQMMYTFEWKGIDERPTYYWDAQDGEGVESGCGDHSWLTEDMKSNRAK